MGAPADALDCSTILEDLVAYVDGEVELLGSEAATRVEAHLAVCPSCQAERDLLVRSWHALDLLDEPVETRPGWLDEVTAAILSEGAAGSPLKVHAGGKRAGPAPARSSWVPVVAAAAALLAVVGLSVAALRSSDSSSQEGTALVPDKPAASTQGDEEGAPVRRLPTSGQDTGPQDSPPEGDWEQGPRTTPAPDAVDQVETPLARNDEPAPNNSFPDHNDPEAEDLLAGLTEEDVQVALLLDELLFVADTGVEILLEESSTTEEPRTGEGLRAETIDERVLEVLDLLDDLELEEFDEA
jgi:Putative zinc-finger